MTFCREQQINKLKNEGLDASKLIDLSKVEDLDPELMEAVLAMLRKWESRIAVVNAATHRDKKRKRERHRHEAEYEQQARFKSHPYLESPRYDGADTNVNPNPQINENSEEALQHELQLQYTPVPAPDKRPRFNPRPY